MNKTRMKVWIAVGLCIVFLMAFVLVYRWIVASRSRDRAEAFPQAVEESRAFGEGRPDQACLDEAIRRAAARADGMDSLTNQIFLNDCLDAAIPTEAFCTGVPAENDVWSRNAWTLARAQAAGLDANDSFQRALFDSVVRRCGKRRGESKKAGR